MFNIGGDSTWATVDFNDSAWYPVTVPDSWENQGFANYDGVAWYRTNFSVDSNYFAHDTLYLHIGKVRDTEQTYINGYFLSDTSRNTDSIEILYHAIPTSLIRQNNLLAIRIYNQSGNGGILSGPVKISVTPPEPSLKKKGPAPHRSTDKDPNLNVGKWSFRDNNRKWLFVICYYNDIPNPRSYTVVRKYKNEHPGFTVLIKEIDWWKKWHKTTILPPNISKEEASVYSQSVAVLKMAQCRERFPARGQIVNSFPPQKKIMSAPLSMGFAIDAFLNSGHYDEALSALQFIMNRRCGSYKHFQWTGENIGIGQNYCISTDHYFGNGLEANSAGEFRPRLYLDNFGVVLWNLKQFVEITNDIKFLEYYWPKISTEIADVIINSIDKADALHMWITRQSFVNFGLIPEYFDYLNSDYTGNIPQCGLGAGIYVSSYLGE
ncbi:hypothetical protein KJ656_13655 [bacterium]|nr:hypothetical protein [bacterium]